VECRDGLLDISLYITSGKQVLDLAPDELAVRLRQAVTRIGEGAPAPRQAVALAMSPGDDQDADVQQLIAVSDALRRAAA